MIERISDKGPNITPAPSVGFAESLRQAASAPALAKATAPAAVPQTVAPDELTFSAGPKLEFPDYKNPENLDDEQRQKAVLELAVSYINREKDVLQKLKAAKYEEEKATQEIVDAQVAKVRVEFEIAGRFEEGDRRIPLWKVVARTYLKPEEKLAEVTKELKKISPRELNSGDALEKYTFLQALAIGGTPRIAEMLQAKGLNLAAAVKPIDAGILTPGSNLLHLAAKENNLDIIDLLLTKIRDEKLNLNVNSFTSYNDTALTLALKNHALDALYVLVNFDYGKTSRSKTKMEPINMDLGYPLAPVLLAVATDTELMPTIKLKSEIDPRLISAQLYADASGTPLQDPRTWDFEIKHTVEDSGLWKKHWEESKQELGENYERDYAVLTSTFTDFRNSAARYNSLAMLFSSSRPLDASKTDENGRNIYAYAAILGEGGMVQMLRFTETPNIIKPDPNHYDNAGWTPLAYAARQMDEMLLFDYSFWSTGANFLIESKGRTPLAILLEERLDFYIRRNPGYRKDPEEFLERFKNYKESPFLMNGAERLFDEPGMDLKNMMVKDINGDPLSLIDLSIRYSDEGLYDKLIGEKGLIPSESQRLQMEAIKADNGARKEAERL